MYSEDYCKQYYSMTINYAFQLSVTGALIELQNNELSLTSGKNLYFLHVCC